MREGRERGKRGRGKERWRWENGKRGGGGVTDKLIVIKTKRVRQINRNIDIDRRANRQIYRH